MWKFASTVTVHQYFSHSLAFIKSTIFIWTCNFFIHGKNRLFTTHKKQLDHLEHFVNQQGLIDEICCTYPHEGYGKRILDMFWVPILLLQISLAIGSCYGCAKRCIKTKTQWFTYWGRFCKPCEELTKTNRNNKKMTFHFKMAFHFKIF